MISPEQAAVQAWVEQLRADGYATTEGQLADEYPRTPADLWFGLLLLRSWERRRDELRAEGRGARALAYAEDASQLRDELEALGAQNEPDGAPLR